MKKFLFPNRLDRIPYLLRATILNLSMLIIASSDSIGSLLVLLVLLVVFVFCAAIPRCRDTGMPLWTLIFVLVPYVGIVYSILLALLKPKEIREKERARYSPSKSKDEIANQSV